jgi:hypothetical protein
MGQDAEMVNKLVKIGLVPGQDFDPSTLRSLDKEATEAVPEEAREKMVMKGQKSIRPHFA